MKRRNLDFGYQRIADQISPVFNVKIDKDVVRRVLARHYRPEPGFYGPSWLMFLGHSKDSLWSVNFLRCESLILKSHWVMVVKEYYNRDCVHQGSEAQSLTRSRPTLIKTSLALIITDGNPAAVV